MLEYLLLVFPLLMAFGAAMDLLTMTIPNRISLLLVAAFVVVAPVAGLSTQDILIHLGVGALMLVAGFALFAFGGFGGGDAKLLAAASLWIGFHELGPFVMAVTLFGGVLAVAIILYRQLPPLPLPEWAERLKEPGTGIPYGIAIMAGALAVYPNTVWFASMTSIAT